MARGGRIELNLALLRLILDLPEHTQIVAVEQSDGERANNVCQLIVSSPFAPVWSEGGELAELRLIYKSAGCCVSELERIEGLDT
jgi:hypothetical protein